jgi:hypothetical protein
MAFYKSEKLKDTISENESFSIRVAKPDRVIPIKV